MTISEERAADLLDRCTGIDPPSKLARRIMNATAYYTLSNMRFRVVFQFEGAVYDFWCTHGRDSVESVVCAGKRPEVALQLSPVNEQDAPEEMLDDRGVMLVAVCDDGYSCIECMDDDRSIVVAGMETTLQ